MTTIDNEMLTFDKLDFLDLETRFGLESARAILRTLEQFEGISENRVAKLSYEDRLRNVMSAMKDNIRFQTRH
jgi:UV DNA damage repair endonuclease